MAECAAPAGEEAVKSVLVQLGIVFGAMGRDAKHWKAATPHYVDALRDVPLEALLKGARDYRDDPGSKFFPLPGELVGRCKPYRDQIIAAAWRSKQLAEMKERAAPPPDDPEERARQIALTQEFLARVKGKSAAAMAPPPRAGQLRRDPPNLDAPNRYKIPTDEMGARIPSAEEMAPGRAMTRVMAETLAKQRGEAPPDFTPEPPDYPSYEEFKASRADDEDSELMS